MVNKREVLAGMELWIAVKVMQGDIDAARDTARDLALLRDSLPTSAESVAALGR